MRKTNKTMRIRWRTTALLLVLILGTVHSFTTGIQSVGRLSAANRNEFPFLHNKNCFRTTLQQTSNDNDGSDSNGEKQTSNNDDDDSVVVGKNPTERTNNNSAAPPPQQQILSAIQTVWGYFIGLFGIAFTAGLVLNLTGYGYDFSLENGLQIDTLEQMRTMRQLEMATNGPPPEAQATGLAGFFLHNPFLSASIVTALVLVYEEIILKSKKR